VPDDQQQSPPDAWTSATWKAAGDVIEVTLYEGIAEVSEAEATNNSDLFDTGVSDVASAYRGAKTLGGMAPDPKMKARFNTIATEALNFAKDRTLPDKAS